MRYYSVQFCDSRKGWQDLDKLASTSQKVANNRAKAVAEHHHLQTRTIRKPKGWVPDSDKEVYKDWCLGFSLTDEIRQSRQSKK